MIDSKWMLSAMMGDALVLRLHITPGRAPKTVAQAFSYWNDDMAYNGFYITYNHDESSDIGLRPLDCRWLPRDPNAWHEHIQTVAESWPVLWHDLEQTVCTIGTKAKNTKKLPPTHPQILTHLARFQAAAALTDASKFESGWGSINLSIVARRLEGLIRLSVKEWRQMVG